MRILSITILLLLVTTSAFSQNRQRGERPNRPSVEERIKNLITILDKELELSEEQEKSVEKVFIEYFESMQELRAAGQRPDMSQFDKINKKRDKDIEALLSESQKKKYEEVKDKLFNTRRRPQRNN